MAPPPFFSTVKVRLQSVDRRQSVNIADYDEDRFRNGHQRPIPAQESKTLIDPSGTFVFRGLNALELAEMGSGIRI